MTLEDLNKTLQRLRKELGQTIVVHVGLPADGGFEILGVDCCGQNNKKHGPLPDKLKPAKPVDVPYIG